MQLICTTCIGVLRCLCSDHVTLHAADGDIRLAPVEGPEEGNAAYGRLELFIGGGWNPVCDSTAVTETFGDGQPLPDAVAVVACRQLGFVSGEKAVAVCARVIKSPHMRAVY